MLGTLEGLADIEVEHDGRRQQMGRKMANRKAFGTL
jgi:hypothetical protein